MDISVQKYGIPALATIGGLYALVQLKKCLDFVWFYLLRPTSGYKAYLKGPSPYALITGATDGIGKGVAKELYLKGFNLILHGRNEEKMQKVIEEFKASGGKGDIKTFFADACKGDHDFKAIVSEFSGLNITVVINNVGGMIHRPIP
jgi:17beta-estradiol 17-dehydrogenase / very-long-chain 3-oxoacyl-CoA reductase